MIQALNRPVQSSAVSSTVGAERQQTQQPGPARPEFAQADMFSNTMKAGAIPALGSFFGSRAETLADKVYNTALKAPGSVTYKKGDAHVFGYRTWTPGTKKGKYPGYNSCARVVSAILMKAGVRTGMQSRVVRLESILQRKGWKKVDVSDVKKGDVVIWKHKGGANHIGVYVGYRLNMHRGFGQTTVDNFSFTGEPEFRALHRETEWGWAVRKVLRPPSK